MISRASVPTLRLNVTVLACRPRILDPPVCVESRPIKNFIVSYIQCSLFLHIKARTFDLPNN